MTANDQDTHRHHTYIYINIHTYIHTLHTYTTDIHFIHTYTANIHAYIHAYTCRDMDLKGLTSNLATRDLNINQRAGNVLLSFQDGVVMTSFSEVLRDSTKSSEK